MLLMSSRTASSSKNITALCKTVVENFVANASSGQGGASADLLKGLWRISPSVKKVALPGHGLLWMACCISHTPPAYCSRATPAVGYKVDRTREKKGPRCSRVRRAAAAEKHTTALPPARRRRAVAHSAATSRKSAYMRAVYVCGRQPPGGAPAPPCTG